MKDFPKCSLQRLAKLQQKQMILFDEKATNNLLKQLQLYLIQVQQIVQKSKKSLGIKTKFEQNLQPAITRDISEINFQISIDEGDHLNSSIKDQLAYSASLPDNSQICKQITGATSLKSDTDSLINKKQSVNHKIWPNSMVQKQITSQNNNYRQVVNITEANINSQNQQKTQSLNSQHCYQYQSEYCIVVNKGNKKQQKQICNDMKNNQFSVRQGTPTNIKKLDKNYMNIMNQSRNNRVKIFKQRYKNCNTKITTETQDLKQKTIQSSHLNTAQKIKYFSDNQIQNVLLSNFQTHKITGTISDQKIRQLDSIRAEFERMKRSIHKQKNQSPIKIKSILVESQNKLQSRSPSKSSNNKKYSNKSPNSSKNSVNNCFESPSKNNVIKLGKNRSPYCKQRSPVKNKPLFLQKYIDSVNGTKDNQGFKINKIMENQQNNCFDKHDDSNYQQNKKCDFQIVQNTKQCNNELSKSQFVDKMLQQCYVRRFLNKNELQLIYNQFKQKKVPKLQWQQKLIQKIFYKIRQVDQII